MKFSRAALWVVCLALGGCVQRPSPKPAATPAPTPPLSQRLEWARGIVSGQCTNPSALSRAWGGIRLAKPGDPEWAEARSVAEALERCRKKALADFDMIARATAKGDRERWAQERRIVALDHGMDMYFSVEGKEKDRLNVVWVLMGPVAMHKITDGGSMGAESFLGQARRLGFRRVSFTDQNVFSRYYDLVPQPTKPPQGLGDPFLLGV